MFGRIKKPVRLIAIVSLLSGCFATSPACAACWWLSVNAHGKNNGVCKHIPEHDGSWDACQKACAKSDQSTPKSCIGAQQTPEACYAACKQFGPSQKCTKPQ
jgi:hypothetical protein